MRDYVEALRVAVESATPALLALGDEGSVRARRQGAWTPREIMGHLIDSASNNHQRFVRAQFTDDLVFPGYEQEHWVAVQRYGDAPWPELVGLWRLYNLHIARVMESTPDDVLDRERVSHNLHEIAWKPVAQENPATLDYFMSDYVGHLKQHLVQILDAESAAD